MSYEDICLSVVSIAGEGSERGIIWLEKWDGLEEDFLRVSHVALESLRIFTLNQGMWGYSLDGISFSNSYYIKVLSPCSLVPYYHLLLTTPKAAAKVVDILRGKGGPP